MSGLFNKTIPNPILPNASEKDKNKENDGFKKFNDIPINPTIKDPPKKTLSPQELLKEKFNYLRKLEALEKRYYTK